MERNDLRFILKYKRVGVDIATLQINNSSNDNPTMNIQTNRQLYYNDYETKKKKRQMPYGYQLLYINIDRFRTNATSTIIEKSFELKTFLFFIRDILLLN